MLVACVLGGCSRRSLPGADGGVPSGDGGVPSGDGGAKAAALAFPVTSAEVAATTGWQPVRVEGVMDFLLPPDVTREPERKPEGGGCGNVGEAQLFASKDLYVVVEVGTTSEVRVPPPPPDFHPSYDPHVTAREVVAGARYPVTLYQVVTPQVNSDARAPDGTWPSSVRTESFVVDGVTPDFKHPYMHSPPFSAAVILEGKRATPELARKILKTVVFL